MMKLCFVVQPSVWGSESVSKALQHEDKSSWETSLQLENNYISSLTLLEAKQSIKMQECD